MGKGTGQKGHSKITWPKGKKRRIPGEGRSKNLGRTGVGELTVPTLVRGAEAVVDQEWIARRVVMTGNQCRGVCT